MSSSSQRPRWWVRAVLLVGGVIGLVWLVTLEITGPDPTGPTVSQTAAVAKKAAPAPRTPPKLGTPRGKELRTAEGEAHG